MKKGKFRFLVRIPLLVVVLLTLWVWQRITVVKTVRANELLRARVQLKNEMMDKVLAEISRLRHHARIEKIATEHLGLVPTRPGQRRFIPEMNAVREKVEKDGWYRFNNSLKRLSAASGAGKPENRQSP